MYNLKDKTKKTTSTIKTVANNIREFIRATSLVVVAVVSGIAAKNGQVHVSGIYGYIVAVAAAIIALEAAYAFWVHFKKTN